MLGAGIAVAIFFLFVLSMSYKRGMKLEKQIGIAGARSIIQMFAMGFALEYIFKLENVWHVVYFAAFMSLFAAYTASSRLELDCRCIRRAFFAIYIPSMIGLLPVFFVRCCPC